MSSARFKVSLQHLSPDAREIRAATEPHDAGLVETARLLELLENFRQVTTPSLAEGEAQITVTTSTGRFNIRTGQGRLLLYNARDVSEPYAELTAEEIVRQLAPRPDVSSDDVPLALPRVRPRHRGIAVAILAAGLALNGYTLYSVFYIDSVNVRPSLKLVTDPEKLPAMRRQVTGTFATGQNPGDRGIVIGADGSVRFTEFGAQGNRYESTDTYRIGHRESTLCLATVDNGAVEVVSHNFLRYYGDVYRRVN